MSLISPYSSVSITILYACTYIYTSISSIGSTPSAANKRTIHWRSLGALNISPNGHTKLLLLFTKVYFLGPKGVPLATCHMPRASKQIVAGPKLASDRRAQIH